jgi:hypothetical protein
MDSCAIASPFGAAPEIDRDLVHHDWQARIVRVILHHIAAPHHPGSILGSGYQAVPAERNWELHAAWPHVAALFTASDA